MPHTTVNPEHAMEARLAQNTCWIKELSGALVAAGAWLTDVIMTEAADVIVTGVADVTVIGT